MNLDWMRKLLVLMIYNLALVAGLMLIPCALSYHDLNSPNCFFVPVLALTAIVISGFLWQTLSHASDREKKTETPSELFSLVVTSWLVTAFAASTPFLISGLSVSDAIFEATSGLTSTGATIINDLSLQSRDILLWRAILNSLGGVGIILSYLIFLPKDFVGIKQVFKIENNLETNTMEHVRYLAWDIILIHCSLTLACTICYATAGMAGFDAICHGLTTSASGGFANYNDSFAHFHSLKIEVVGELFMILSSLPFVMYLRIIKGEFNWDEQINWFFGILLLGTAVITSYLYHFNEQNVSSALRLAFFNFVSILTSSGFATADYYRWGGFVGVMMLIAQFSGGCSGSTTGGVKISRLIIILKSLRNYIIHITKPHKVVVVSYNQTVISDEEVAAIYKYMALYLLIMMGATLAATATGLDFITGLSGVVASLTNSGPGLGEIIGPAGNYYPLSSGNKFLFATLMIAGRLEIIPVIIFLYSLLTRAPKS